MSLLYDPRFDRDELADDYFQHFGVKGMRWGVRRTRNHGERVRKAYTKSDALGRDQASTDAKVARLKVDKAEAMQNYQEHLGAHNAKTASRVSKMQAEKKRVLDEFEQEAKNVEATGKAGKLDFFRSPGEKRDQHAQNIRDWKDEVGKDFDHQINKYKAKRQKQADAIRTEMTDQGKKWDEAVATVKSQNTGKSISTGKANTNIFLTGNPDGRITKSTVIGYGLAAAMVGAMAYDMYKS